MAPILTRRYIGTNRPGLVLPVHREYNPGMATTTQTHPNLTTATIRRIEYFYSNIKDQPGEAYRLLTRLDQLGTKLLAFSAMPTGVNTTQFALFVDDARQFERLARQASISLDGPYQALLVQGDAQLDDLADIHRRLFEGSVNVYASTGMADEQGNFHYVIYIKPEDFERAARLLDV